MKFFDNESRNVVGRKPQAVLLILALVLSLSLLSLTVQEVFALGEPTRPSGITDIQTWNGTNVTQGYNYTTQGGEINYILLNVSQQNTRWKAYVGNITGELVLSDANNNSIFDWAVVNPTGEIYATRFNDTIDWTSIGCADAIDMIGEQANLTMNETADDLINLTFNYTQHQMFYVGSVQISADSCPSTAMYVSDTPQLSDFQEVLLNDGNGIIYTAIIENAQTGFNDDKYDFQMIVPENATIGASPIEYFFYIEIT